MPQAPIPSGLAAELPGSANSAASVAPGSWSPPANPADPALLTASAGSPASGTLGTSPNAPHQATFAAGTYAGSAPTDLDEALAQHLALHNRYLEGQLRVADGLVDALNQHGEDAHLAAAVESITRQSLSIGDTHIRASEILGALTELGHRNGVTPVARVTTSSSGSNTALHNGAPTHREALMHGEVPVNGGTYSPAAPAAPAILPTQPASYSPAPQTPPASAVDVQAAVTEVVAEKTGYPAAMLDPTMDLEADLGIDSIKRVQILGVLQTKFPGLPQVGPEKLAELHTLADIADFVRNDDDQPAPIDPTAAVTEVVAEKTGYPAAMLDPTMDLEADLGIDSIKRVQILGVLQTKFPGLPQVGPEKLAELHTLADIADFVRGDKATAEPTPDPTAAVTEVVAEKTGYPAAMLDPTMDLEADLGIDSIKRVQILGVLQTKFPGLPQVGPEKLAELHTLADIAAFVRGEEAVAVVVEAPVAETTSSERYRLELETLPAIDRLENAYPEARTAVLVEDGSPDGDGLAEALEQDGWTVHRTQLRTQQELPERIDLCLMVLPSEDAWQANVTRLEAAVLLAGRVQDPLKTSAAYGNRAAFVSLTRLDGGLGHHGTTPAGLGLIGGIGGLVKTMAQEASELFCRALDIAPGVQEVGALVLAELADVAKGVHEVGIDGEHKRHTPRMRLQEQAELSEAPEITSEDVIVVTGGARGVTADCLQALLAETPCELVLLGRTDLGDEDEPAWAKGFTGSELKAAAAKQLSEEGGARVTPVQVERLVRQLTARREVRQTLDRLRASGSTVTYLAVDVADGRAVREAFGDLRHRVTGLVHGAGALADAYLPAKTADAVHTVFSPKLEGLGHLLQALEEAPLRHVVLFGSVAGVLGNPGQADYASANEAFGRIAANLRHSGRAAHAVALNWGPWDGGMVTPELREVFQARGVPLIAPADGARRFVEQFQAAHAAETYVLVGSLTPLAPEEPSASPAFTARRDLDVLHGDPVLTDHEVGSSPVLPAAAGLGWIANGLEAAYPGLEVIGVEGFQVHNGIVFDETTPSESVYRLEAEAGEISGSDLKVRAAVRGTVGDGLPKSHFAGTFRLGARPSAKPARLVLPQAEGTDGAELYASAELFHGPLLQGIRRVLVRESDRLVFECRLPETPLAENAFATPLHRPLQADVVLQAAGLLGLWTMNEACLPLGIGSATFYAPLPDDEPFIVVVDGLRTGGGMDLTVNATACTPEGEVLQVFTDISEVATPGMSARFREAADRRDARYPA